MPWYDPRTWFAQDAAPAFAPPPALVPAEMANLGPMADLGTWSVRADGSALYNPLSGLGMWGDKGSAGRVNINQQALVWGELDQIYRFNGYGHSGIDAMPAEACRKGWSIVDDSDETDPMATRTKDLRLVEHTQTALTWGLLHGGALLLLVTDDVPDDPGMSSADILESPLNLDTVRGIKAIQVMSRYEAYAVEWVTDIADPDFKRPKIWLITPLTPGGSKVSSWRVHHSRVAYFGGERLPPLMQFVNSGFDDSALQSTWDPIRQITQIDQAAANLAQEWQVGVQKVKGLSALTTSDQAQAFAARMQAQAIFKSQTNTLMMDADDDFILKQARVAGWKDITAGGRSSLAAARRLPETFVFGKSPEGLNTDGESQRAHVANVVAGYQTHRMEQPLTKIYTILFCARRNAEGIAIPKSWRVEFPPYDELTETQQAALLFQRSQTGAILIQEGVMTAAAVAKSLFNKQSPPMGWLPIADPEQESEEAQAQGAEIAGKPVAVPSQRPSTPSPKAPYARARAAGDSAELDMRVDAAIAAYVFERKKDRAPITDDGLRDVIREACEGFIREAAK